MRRRGHHADADGDGMLVAMSDLFSPEDLLTLERYVAERWMAGVDADWSARAGTLEWSCTATADHAVDCVYAPAIFLASRRTDRYPDLPIFTAGPDAGVSLLVESLEVMCRLVVDVVNGTPSDVRAVLFAGSEPILGEPADFVPRAGHELMLHAHDVCAGLGIEYEPDPELARRLRDHTADWPMWTAMFGREVARTDDPWGDLLLAAGRHR
jgi:hypothetical protein